MRKISLIGFVTFLDLFILGIVSLGKADLPHGCISLSAPDERGMYVQVDGLHPDGVQIFDEDAQDHWLVRRRVIEEDGKYVDLLQSVPESVVAEIGLTDRSSVDDSGLDQLQRDYPYVLIGRDPAYYESGEYKYEGSLAYKSLFEWDSRTVAWITGLDGRIYVAVSEKYNLYNGFCPLSLEIYENSFSQPCQMTPLSASYQSIVTRPEGTSSNPLEKMYISTEIAKLDVEYDDASGLWCFAVTMHGNMKDIPAEASDAYKVRFTVLDKTLIPVSSFLYGEEYHREDVEKDIYYTQLLKCIQKKENPLANAEIHRIVKERLLRAKFSDEQVKKILTALTQGEDTYRDLFLLTFYQYSIEGTENVVKSAMGTNRLMRIKLSQLTPSVFFHEAGHAIERTTRMDINEEMTNNFVMIYNDVRNRLERSLRHIHELFVSVINHHNLEKKAINSIVSCIEDASVRTPVTLAIRALTWVPSLTEDEITKLVDDMTGKKNKSVDNKLEKKNEGYVFYYTLLKTLTQATIGYEAHNIAEKTKKERSDNACMVWDMESAITDNRINSYFTGEPHAGIKWWQTDDYPSGNIPAEGWAEFFSAVVTNDKRNMERNAEHFPFAAGDGLNVDDTIYPHGGLGHYAEMLYQEALDYYTALYTR